MSIRSLENYAVTFVCVLNMGSDALRLYCFYLETNPNFNTNAPPFEVRGCKVILGGAFLVRGVQPLDWTII